MLKNHLLVALRNIQRNQFFAFLNSFGLILGITSFLFIYVFVEDERNYDQFHKDVNRVYRVNTYWGDDPEGDIYATTPAPLYFAIKDEVPEVEAVSRAFWWNDSTMRLPKSDNEDREEKVFRETKVYIVDAKFLEVLDFNLIAGEAKTAFEKAEGLVLTKETAIRYFGESAFEKGEVLGKEILFGGNKTPRTVTAIVDPTPNTHFHFDMLVNIEFGYKWFSQNENWAWNMVHTYVKFQEGTIENNFEQIQSKFIDIAQKYGEPFMLKNNPNRSEHATFEYRLQNVADIHLHSHFLREHEANGNAAVVNGLSLVAILLLLMAVINFTNLATAKAAKRAKEVGVRKVLGSQKRILISQFLTESILFSMISGFISIGLAEAFRIPFNELTEKQIEFQWLHNPSLIILVFSISLVVGILAGLYPAFYLSNFKPIQILKGKMIGNTKPTSYLRNSLIIFQFVISIGLITCSVVVFQQISFIQNKELGFNREQIVVIKNDKEIKEEWQAFKDHLAQKANIKSVSFTSSLPTQTLLHMRDIREKNSPTGEGINWMRVDEDYFSTMEMEMVEGRAFDEDFPTDVNGIILNEKAVDLLDLQSPYLGKEIVKNMGRDDEENLKLVGIVKDYNVESLHNNIKPLAIQMYRPSHVTDLIAVKFSGGNPNEQIAQLEAAWKAFQPENPFVYFFLDESFDALFKSEQRLGKILSLFTLLTILIACLGLFGLAAYTAEKRTKEIGIRKALGARVRDIVLMLSKSFSLLIVIAAVIAIPISYGFSQLWLENFAYKIDIQFWVFILTGLATLVIAWLTVGYQSLKAAMMNPIRALRDE